MLATVVSKSLQIAMRFCSFSTVHLRHECLGEILLYTTNITASKHLCNLILSTVCIYTGRILVSALSLVVISYVS